MSDDTRTENGADDARENVNEQGREPEREPTGGDVWDDVARAALEQFEGVTWDDSRGQSVLHVPRDRWLEVARWLRDEQGFEMCSDLCGVDHLLNARRPLPAGVEAERLEVVANFLSMSGNRRLRVRCPVPVDEPSVPSLTPVYPGVDYSERETFDLFGIVFEGHPDLTRILLPEDWEGWPLRKDDAAARVPVQFKGTATTPDQQALRRSRP